MSNGSSVPPVRAVNLGGWLLVEGWIKPSLFKNIPRNEFLDGTQVQFKSVKTGNYLAAEHGGGGNIVAEEPKASSFGTFRLWRINEKQFNFRVAQDQFVGLSKAGNTRVVAAEEEPGSTEIFDIIQRKVDGAKKLVKIKASNGYYLQVKSKKEVTADYKGEGWAADDPSVFEISINTWLHGEYQLVNGYGTHCAPQVMKEHWSTFIVEDDFVFMKKNGINTVRIPVGWWTAHGDNPPKPYVAGSLHYLDKAFSWAEKHGIKVLVDLHAAPGCQNGSEVDSSRDGEEEWEADSPLKHWRLSRGFHEWVKDESNIQKSIKVIEFFAARYGKRAGLLGVELLNEPKKPYVHLEVLMAYYKKAYDAVRKHSKDAYVVMCDRVGKYGEQDPSELVPLVKPLHRAVIDVHYYNMFEPKFKDFTVQQNIDYIKKERANELKKLRNAGVQVFVGEWVDGWQVKNATKKDYQKFGEVQMEVYGGDTTFGWSYWALKNFNDDHNYKHWSLEWNIKNGYIKIN